MEKKDEPKKADMYDLAIRNSNNDVNTLKVSENNKNSYLDSGNNIMTNTDGRQLSFKPEGIPGQNQPKLNVVPETFGDQAYL